MYVHNQTILADCSYYTTTVCIYEVFTLLPTGTIATYVRTCIHTHTKYLYTCMQRRIIGERAKRVSLSLIM